MRDCFGLQRTDACSPPHAYVGVYVCVFGHRPWSCVWPSAVVVCLSVRGTGWWLVQVGYLYVRLLSNETAENYASLMNSLTSSTLIQAALGVILDWQVCVRVMVMLGACDHPATCLRGINTCCAAACPAPGLSAGGRKGIRHLFAVRCVY